MAGPGASSHRELYSLSKQALAIEHVWARWALWHQNVSQSATGAAVSLTAQGAREHPPPSLTKAAGLRPISRAMDVRQLS